MGEYAEGSSISSLFLEIKKSVGSLPIEPEKKKIKDEEENKDEEQKEKKVKIKTIILPDGTYGT